ncbi:hypothetical protein ACFFOS_20545 [Nocardioides kongjuensis]|uniref:Uncharacterized protein n=1 Tax=Nocardioides kongjuensis TaxID=349522 RepID=A0A852RM37_9ACTN|nr:hypothetical protein [Nocardioides kongjuensis]NYD31729.1 hypothetical protein [Nocardioides kongjuensis]
MDRVERERRHRLQVLAGLTAAEAAAAVLAVVFGFLVSVQGRHGPLPADVPEPTPAPPPVIQAPGTRDPSGATTQVDGVLP